MSGEFLNNEEFHAQRAQRERRARLVRTIVVAAVACVIIAFVGVGVMFAADDYGNESGSSERHSGTGLHEVRADGTGSSATHTVVDSLGRTVEVPEEPLSIAIMDSFSGEVAVMLGAGERIAGLPSGVKSDRILQMIYPDLQSGPVSTSGSTINIETLASLACDVAIVKTTMAEDELAKLDKLKIPYAVVDYATFDEQMDALRLVGEVCGGSCGDVANELIGYYLSLSADVQARTAALPEASRARVYHSINDALLTDSGNSLGADWIALAGCADVSAGEAATSGSDFNATLEQVYVWDPALIICNAYTATQEFASEAKWAALDAVANGNVRTIPVGATRWGQRGSAETALAMVWLGTVAYPDLFADVDLESLVKSYYERYFGVNVDDALYAQIISGEGVRSGGTGSGDGSGSGGGNR